MREFLGSPTNPRNEIGQRREIARDPERQRTGQPPVGLGEDDQRADRENRDEPERVDHLHHRIAERGGGLNDVRGDPACEVVGEIGQGLAQDIAMRLPADEVGHPRSDRLLREEIMREVGERTADENQQPHGQEFAAVFAEQSVRARRAQRVDEGADEAQDRHFDQRDDQADRHQCDEERPDLPAIAPVIAEQARGRHAFVVLAKRIDAGFEEAEHEKLSCRKRGRGPISA